MPRTPAARPRRSVILVGAAGALALLGAVAILAFDGGGAGSASSPGPAPAVRPMAGEGGAAAGGTAAPAPDAGGLPETASSPDEEPPPPVADGAPAEIDSGAEPAPEAWGDLVAELAARWESCRRAVMGGAAPESCEEDVVQPGSAAAEQLGSPVTTVADGLLSPRPDEVVVVDRLGSATLLDLFHVDGTRTASLLVMRSEAGWRIRSVLD